MEAVQKIQTLNDTPTVTVSQDFRISFPSQIRQSSRIKPGQKYQIITYDNRIELIPVKKISDMRGFLKGIDPTVNREMNRV